MTARAVRKIFLLLALVNMTGSGVQVYAQVVAASIQGSASDPARAPIPKVAISVRNMDTGTEIKTMSDTKGFYAVTDLQPGTYEITASMSGFITLEVTIPLAMGEQRRIALKMQPGESNSSRRQAESGTGLQSNTSAIAGVADASTVRDLPSNGRDWTQAATLQAGVSAVKTQPDASDTNSGRGQRGFGAQISMSGGRPQQNNYILNGISINDYANAAPGSVLGLDLGADAVEQFSVVTSNYPADYGRSSGGVINAITRSGTNKFHGSVYEFLRNSALDARNFFDSTKPPFRRNQFGVTAGGPIRKNRTFAFLNFEGLRQSLGVTHVDTVPSPAARLGLLSTGTVPLDPQAARYLAFFPLPNRGLLASGDTGVFAFSGQQVTPENYFTGKVDHSVRKQDVLSVSYVFDSAQTTQPDSLNVRLNEIQTRRNLVALQETHIFSSELVNTFRFGVNRVVALIGKTPQALNPLAADTSYGFLPGHTSGNINVLGLTNFTGGLGAASPFDYHWTSFQAYDDANKTAGAHSLRFGFAVERMRDNMFGISDPNGVFTFNSLSDFLTNRPFSLSIALPQSMPSRDLRQTLFAGYVQDDIRVASNLTVNLGLRYETTTVPSEVHGRLSNLRYITDSTPHLGNDYFSNPTHKNFEPRVGFSWDPARTGRVLLRGGFGIFDVLPLPYEFELVSLFAAPYFENATPNNLLPGSFPYGAVAIASTANTFRYANIQPNPRRNYVNQWNFNVEFRPCQNWTMLAGYVGSRGIHQPFRADDTNLVLPTPTRAGYIWPTPVGSGTKLNPGAGRIDGLSWMGNSWYDALQLQARANVGRSLQFQASYTWGKSLDTGSATIAGDQFANSVASLPWYDLRLAKGPSDFNIGRTLSTHFTLEIPVGGWASRHELLAHWRLNGTFQASTGAPFTPVIGGDPLGTHSTNPYDVPNRLAIPGCSDPVNSGNPSGYLKLQCFAFPNPSTLLGNLSRNSINGPGLANLDLSIFKDSFIKRVSETFNVQFRVEVFNILNHANFSPPLNHRTLFDGSGNSVPGAGLIDSTATPSRQMQVGVKIIW